MITKERIGKRIYQLRCSQQLSREQLCQDGSELTARQLRRIENGESLPTIVKLSYIAQVLDVPVSTLLGEETLTLPQDYLDEKYKLLKNPSYGDEDRLNQKYSVLETLYNNYYDILPEDELIFLDLIERKWDLMRTNLVSNKVSAIYNDYYAEVLQKDSYNFNDLCLIEYYIMQHYVIQVEQSQLEHFKNHLLQQKVQGDENYNVQLLATLSNLLGYYIQATLYHQIPKILNRINEVVQESAQFFYRPLSLAVEAKYTLYYEKNLDKAKELYEMAKVIAQSFGDSVMANNIECQKDRDLALFSQEL